MMATEANPIKNSGIKMNFAECTSYSALGTSLGIHIPAFVFPIELL